MGTAEQKRRVDDAADVLDLTDYIKRRPGQLSGGQRQRVAIGRVTPLATEGPWKGAVGVSEHLGSDTFFHVQMEGRKTPVTVRAVGEVVTRDDGTAIAPNDPHWGRLTTAARAAKLRPAAWLEQGNLYGDLSGTPEFATAFGHWLDLLWSSGTAATLEQFCRS